MTESAAIVSETSQLVDSLNEAVKATFDTILGERPKACGSVDTSVTCSGLIGIIAVIGDVSWSVSLGFPEDTAMRMAEQFAGFEIEFDSADMGDVIGELANVLAGDVVARLDALGVRVQMSLPSVARVSEFHILKPGAVESLLFKYLSSQGEFVVGLAMAKPIRRPEPNTPRCAL